MASLAEILKQFKLSGTSAAIERTELVPGSAPAQIRDAGQSILPWDKEEYLAGGVPDDVIAQVKAVRALLPDPGADWTHAKLASDLAFMTGVDKKTKAKVGPGIDPSKCVMFTDTQAFKRQLGEEIDVDCKALHAAWQAEDDPRRKTAARVQYMKTMAFKHLMNGREGPSSAINTYDNAIFTWGMGFGANGSLPRVLKKISSIERSSYPDDLEKHYVQKFFYLCGFKFDGRYWAVDVDKKRVFANDTADPTAADSAFRTIHGDFDFHRMWVLVARDPLTLKTVLEAQRDVFFTGTGDVANAEKIQTAALYTFLAHLQHWTGDTQMGMVDWALGPYARPKVKASLPSEEGDALLAKQAAHRFYWKRNPDFNVNAFVQVRKYWREMVRDDTNDEGLTAFHPDYAIMAAAAVASVPESNLGGAVGNGTYYDLGPLADFARTWGPAPAVDVEPEAKAAETDSTAPEDSEGMKWQNMPVVVPQKAPPPTPVEQPSWWRRIFF